MLGFGKLCRAAKNAFLNYTEVEVVVREATRSGRIGAEPKLMQRVAELTYDPNSRSEVMGIVWKRVKDLTCYAHVLNSLELIDHLIQHGSFPVVTELQERAVELEDLRNYVVGGGGGKTYGGEVRSLAAKIFQLLQDDKEIQNVRQLAIRTRMMINFNAIESFGRVDSNSGLTSPAPSIGGSLDSLLRFGLIRDQKRRRRSASTLTLKSFTGVPDELGEEAREGVDYNNFYDDKLISDKSKEYETSVGIGIESDCEEEEELLPRRLIAETIYYSGEVIPSSQLTEKINESTQRAKMGLGSRIDDGQDEKPGSPSAIQQVETQNDQKTCSSIEDRELQGTIAEESLIDIPGPRVGDVDQSSVHQAGSPHESLAQSVDKDVESWIEVLEATLTEGKHDPGTQSDFEEDASVNDEMIALSSAMDFNSNWDNPQEAVEEAWSPILTESGANPPSDDGIWRSMMLDPTDLFGTPSWFADLSEPLWEGDIPSLPSPPPPIHSTNPWYDDGLELTASAGPAPNPEEATGNRMDIAEGAPQFTLAPIEFLEEEGVVDEYPDAEEDLINLWAQVENVPLAEAEEELHNEIVNNDNF